MYLSELIEEVKKSNIVEEAKVELIEILEIGLEDPLSQEIEKGREKQKMSFYLVQYENGMTQVTHEIGMSRMSALNDGVATVVAEADFISHLLAYL